MNKRNRLPRVLVLKRILTSARSFGLRLRAKNWLRPAFAAAALHAALVSSNTRTRNTRMKPFAMAIALVMLTTALAVDALAQQIECSSPTGKVAAVTNPAGHVITTRYQLDVPNLQTLLTTTINAKRGCLVAHLSGSARITDNYVVFQVRVDGVPMEGHLPGLIGFPTPVVFVSIDASPANDDEQFIDPTKVVAYNFFTQLDGGTHTVEVLAAGGSNILAPFFPSVNSLVLTLEYR